MNNLSPYGRLKLSTEIDDFHLEDRFDSFDFDLESQDGNQSNWKDKIVEYIKKFIKWFKERLVKIRQFIKEKLRKWFNVSHITFITERIKDGISLGLLKSQDPTDTFIIATHPSLMLIKDANEFSKRLKSIKDKMDTTSDYSLESSYGKYSAKMAYKKAKYANGNEGWLFLLNGEGKIRKDEDVIKNTLDVVNFILDPKTTYDDIVGHYNLDRDDLAKEEEQNGKKGFSYLGQDYLIPHCLDGRGSHKIFSIKRDKVNFDSINSIINDLDKRYKDVEIKMEKMENEINRKLDEKVRLLTDREKRNREEYDKVIWEIDKLHLVSSLIKVPIYHLLNLSRFLEGLSRTLFSEHYITTLKEPAKPIYHLSQELGLGKSKNWEGRRLMVRFPISGNRENLPERTSFSPSPELCCYGLGHHMPVDRKAPKNEERKIRMYLYEGIQVTGKTKYLKPELVKCAISSDSHMSQEICVVSDIEIKYLGEVNVYYDPHKSLTDPNRYRIENK